MLSTVSLFLVLKQGEKQECLVVTFAEKALHPLRTFHFVTAQT